MPHLQCAAKKIFPKFFVIFLATAENFEARFHVFITYEWRIRFKLATSTYKTLHTGHPPYLTDLPQYHKSSVSTHSSTSQLLAIPRHNLSFGSRSFRVSAPRIWNSLTPQIRQCQTLATFRCHVRSQPFLPPSVHHPMRPDSF